MPFSKIKRQLTARGYWDAADGGEGQGGGSGGGSGGSGEGGQGGSAGGEGGAGGSADDAKVLQAQLKELTDKLAASENDKAKLLKETMQRKDELKKLGEQLKAFEGINVDEVKKLLDDRKQQEVKDLEARGQWDALKKQMNDAHAAELAKRDSELADLRAQLSAREGMVANLTVGQSFAQSRFINEELSLTPGKARIVYGPHFENQDGKVVAYDKPAGASNRTMLVDGKGEPLDFESAIEKIVKADPDYERLVKAKGKPGAGSGNAGNAGNTGAPPKDSGLTGRYRIAAGLAAAAGKK